MSDTLKLAERLTNMYAEWDEARGPKAVAVAAARFTGACEVASILGYGMTEWELNQILKDAVGEFGPRPAATGMNKDRKQWFADVVTYVRRAIDEVRVD